MRAIKLSLISVVLILVAGVLPAGQFDAFEFRNVGPARGGRVTAVAGSVAAPSTFYLGATGGGVWKTVDYGTSWKVVSDGFFETPSIGDIAVAQNDANIVYVGTGTDGLRSNTITGKGMYKSVDGGTSWQHTGLREAGQIGAVEIDPRNHNIVWVAAIGQAFNANQQRGLYKSGDGGKTWTNVLFISDTVGIADVELLPGNPDIVFATAWKAQRKPWTIISGGGNDEGGLFKSVDSGASWTRITAGLPQGLIGKIDLAISPADSSIVYALVEAPDDEGGLYKSVDQGETFAQVSDDEDIRTRPFYYTNIDVDPKNPDIVWAMATGYFKSVDGGETWERVSVPHGDNHDMWINPDNPELFIQSNDGGANVTQNGGETWSTQFNQPTAELYQVEVDDQYPYWLYAGQQDNYSTIAVPSQAPWAAQHPAAWFLSTGGCETGPAVPKPGNHNIVYANCKGRFGVFDKRIGTEKGYYIGAANMYGHNPGDLRYRFQRVSPIHVSPHDPDVVYHASQYVHRTRDDGRTWETISPDLTAFEADKQVISGSPITRDITGEEFYSTIYALRESPLQRGVIWAGSNDGPVHVTQDDGQSWQNVTPRRLPPGGRVDAVEPSPHEPSKAYIAVLRYQLGDWKPYIYKTEDYGRRWQLLTDGSNGIPHDYPTRVVREDPVREGLLFAGTEFGLFVSLDDGDTWQEFQQNLPVTPVTDIKVHRGNLAVSTMGRSFWVLDSIAALRQDAMQNLGSEVVLFKPADTIRYRKIYSAADAHPVPDYPTPAVMIDYYLPEDASPEITLEILDAHGKRVNSFHSDAGVADEGEADEQEIEDMGSGEDLPDLDESLTANAGTNRFHWVMTHSGAWHEDEDERYQEGPMAAPGRYRARLSVGETVAEQDFALITDPRVAAGGTSDQDITDQVVLELKLIGLLSDARRLEHKLAQEVEELEAHEVSAALSDAESRRLEMISGVLRKLQTADIIYPQPMLSGQISYLYNMISHADQAPGKEAEDRYEILLGQFNTLRHELENQVQ